MNIHINRICKILDDLENCIKNHLSFSLIRFGDGGLKLIMSLLVNNTDGKELICKKEGIPIDKLLSVVQAWSYYAQKANYIDCAEVYFSDEFWPRYKNPHKKTKMSYRTMRLLKSWNIIYELVKFNNINYCNPEINFLSILRIDDRKNLLDVIKNKKICLITNHEIFLDNFKKNISEDSVILKIVGWNENHYEKCFKKTIEFLKINIDKYDIFLVGAGELGRIYSGFIKDHGGRSFDLGTVFDYWCDKRIPKRLQTFLEINPENNMELILTEKSEKYKDFI